MTSSDFFGVFPENYQNPPTEKQLIAEVEERIASGTIPFDLLYWLRHTECPYLREARARVLRTIWKKLVSKKDERACYIYDGCLCYYWPDYIEDLRSVIEDAQGEQEINAEAERSLSAKTPVAAPAPQHKPSETDKLISKIKKEVACKVEYHFHGPVNFTDVHDNQSVTLQPA